MGIGHLFLCITLCLDLHLATAQLSHGDRALDLHIKPDIDLVHDSDGMPHSTRRSTVVKHKLGSSAVLACAGYDLSDPMASSAQWSAPGSRVYNSTTAADDWDNIVTNSSSRSLSNNRVVLLHNGSLVIQHVQRLDAGLYVCRWGNDSNNDTFAVHFRLDSSIIYATKVESMLFGIACALSFLVTGILVAAIRYVSFRCSAEERQRRQSIRQLLERIQDYKAEKMVRFSAKMGRLSAYKTAKMDQLFAFRTAKLDRLRTYKTMTMTNILHHVDRMRDHYATQSSKVKANCARQARGLRHKYHLRLGRFNDYRSHHMVRLRDSYRGQLTRIHEYGSQQMDKLRDQYRSQQQYIVKLMELLDIGNCVSVVDEECKLAETILFEPVLPLSLVELETDALPDDNENSEDDGCESIRVKHRVSFAEGYNNVYLNGDDDSSVSDSMSLRALRGSTSADQHLGDYEFTLSDNENGIGIDAGLAVTGVVDETIRVRDSKPNARSFATSPTIVEHKENDNDEDALRSPKQQQRRRISEPVEVRVHRCLVETRPLREKNPCDEANCDNVKSNALENDNEESGASVMTV